MSNIEIPDLIKSASEAVQDNLLDTMKQTDGILSTVVGFFNNVVLYPVKKANLTFKYKLEAFEDDLKEKIKNIPQENLQEPPIMIAGPTLEALRYTYDEKELREMYENLLACSMDSRCVSKVHPSFVDAIKQLSPLDAKVLKEIVYNNSVLSVHIKLVNKSNKYWYPDALPYHFSKQLIELGDPFEISASISNLIRLGLVKTYSIFIDNSKLKDLMNHKYINTIIASFPEGGITKKVEACENIVLDDYGKSFAETCIDLGDIFYAN